MTAFRVANKNGKIIIFSGLKNLKSESCNLTNSPTIDANFIHYNQTTVMGSFSSTPENLKEAMKLVDSGEIRIERFNYKYF